MDARTSQAGRVESNDQVDTTAQTFVTHFAALYATISWAIVCGDVEYPVALTTRACTNPASSSSDRHSVPESAPATQVAHAAGSSATSAGISPTRNKSANENTPPGASTRKISAYAASLLGTRFITPFEITT